MLNKSGKFELNFWTVLVIAILLYAFVPGFKGAVDGIFSGLGGVTPTPTTPTTPVRPDICIYDGATMTVGPAQERWNPSVSMSAVNHRVWLNGRDNGLKADGSTMSVTYKDKIGVIYGDKTDDYYKAYIEFNVPCSSTFQTSDFDTEAKESEMYAIADIENTAFKIFSEDDGLLMQQNSQKGTTTGATEALTDGDVITLSASLQGIYEDAASPYGTPLLICDYPSAKYDTVKILKVGGGEYSKATATPSLYTATTSGNVYTAYEFEKLISNQKIDFQIYLDVADSGVSVTDAMNVTCQYWDQDYYVNSNTGAVALGYQTDNNSNVGTGVDQITPNFTLFVVPT